MNFPGDIEKLKIIILELIKPIIPANDKTTTVIDFIFNAKRTKAGFRLPPYYIVYFLFVKLLKFKNLGRFEKTAWSIPIDYNGSLFLIEYRKMGLGLFAHDVIKEEKQAEEIVSIINKASKKAEPYFNFIAQTKVNGSNLNVNNNSLQLRDRFEFFLSEYKKLGTAIETVDNCSEKHTIKIQANWMALSAIDAFFSWTEHIFIHIAILQGKLTTGKSVTDMAVSEWKSKYKLIFDISKKVEKQYYDKLGLIRQQLRNFYAHGAFGKTGEAFKFHSETGAVPVQIFSKSNANKFSLNGPSGFKESDAIAIIEKFISFLWEGELLPAKIYIEDSSLPLILSYSKNGTYKRAMSTVENMTALVEGLSREFDNAANMDWW